jgi:hypothetical protein
MALSWCDTLASHATIGLRLTPKFRTSQEILGHVASLFLDQIKPLSQGDGLKFTMERADHFDVSFTLSEGYRYTIGPTHMSIADVHRVEILNASAARPWLRFMSKDTKFTDTIPEISERILALSQMLDDSSRTITRCGLISQTVAPFSEFPPGILDLIHESLKPWGPAPFFFLQVVTILTENDNYTDRCIHTFSKVEDEDVVPTIGLDWHRTFIAQKTPMRRNAAKDLIDDCVGAALSYFEKLGEKGPADA